MFIHKTEVFPNQNHICIHLKKLVAGDRYVGGSFADEKSKENPLWKRLMAIQGVTEVSLKNYEVGITKGKAFNWSEILPETLTVLYAYAEELPDNIVPCLPSYVQVFSYVNNFSKQKDFIDNLKVEYKDPHEDMY